MCVLSLLWVHAVMPSHGAQRQVPLQLNRCKPQNMAHGGGGKHAWQQGVSVRQWLDKQQGGSCLP